MFRAFDLPIQSMIHQRLKSLMQHLDNEVQQGIDFQLVPHTHHKYNAERIIPTFKNNFIAGICSVEPSFPPKRRDNLLPQATITLNIIKNRGSTYASPPMHN
jgi:hypothetical protein